MNKMDKPHMSFEINTKGFSDSLDVLGYLVKEGAQKELMIAGYEILSRSLDLVPIDTGTLAKSADLSVDKAGEDTYYLIAGYGYGDGINPNNKKRPKDYMVTVHEDLEAQHEHGRSAKFLEIAYNEYVSGNSMGEAVEALNHDVETAWDNLGLNEWNGSLSKLNAKQLGYLSIMEGRAAKEFNDKKQQAFMDAARRPDTATMEKDFSRLFPGKEVDPLTGNMKDKTLPRLNLRHEADPTGEREYGIGVKRHHSSYYDD